MSARAFTLVAGGDAGWLSDDVPSILGRPARSYRSSPPPATPAYLLGCWFDVPSVSSHLNVAVARLVSCRDPAPVNRKSDAVDEAGIIAGEEDDRRGKFLGLSYATCWC